MSYGSLSPFEHRGEWDRKIKFDPPYPLDRIDDHPHSP